MNNIVKLRIDKSVSGRSEISRNLDLVSTFGQVKLLCEDRFIAFLTLPKCDAPTAIKLLKETGFKAVYVK